MPNINDHPSLIYVIAPDENGPCKIGKTIQIAKRHQGIQVGSWLPLAVFGARLCLTSGAVNPGNLRTDLNQGAYAAEAATHKALKEMGLHMIGEWFDVTAQEALKAIEVACKKSGISAIGLDALISQEIPENEQGLVRKARENLIGTLMGVNSYCRETLDKLGAME